MRFKSIHGVLATGALVVLAGCSSGPSFAWKNPFSRKNNSDSSSTASTTAPGAPPFNTSPAAPGMPTTNVAAHSAGDLPTYPGTNYQVTPYAAPTMPTSVAAAPAGYSAPAGYTPTGAGYANDPNAAQTAQSTTPPSTTYQYQPPQNQTPAAPNYSSAPYNGAGSSGTFMR